MSKRWKILIIGKVWVEPNSSAAGSRMLKLINMLQNADAEIIFASTAAPSSYSVSLSQFNIKTHNILLNDASFDTFLQKTNPNLVIFDRFMTEEQFGWRVRSILPETLQVLDTEDLHFLRDARQEAVKSNRNFKLDDCYSEMAKREIASILRSDVSLIISKFEMNLLLEQFKIPSSKLFYLPILFDKLPTSIPSFEERKDFVFIGNFLHEPNWDAVRELKKYWTKIKNALPETQLQIYGAYPSQKVFQLHSHKDGFLINGRAESAKEVISKARVLLAPLRFGAGLKGKLLEAMFWGTPSITTSIGSEGIIDKGENWAGTVQDDWNEISSDWISLYQNEANWKSAQDTGNSILQNGFMQNNFEGVFIDKITYLLEHLHQHRNENFLGEVLQHHTLQSTKYLSKWIEEKNKV